VIHAIGTYGEHGITIEMDAKTIVDSARKKTYPRFYWGKIARNCGDVMNRKPNVSIRWVRRTGNKVAHSLAKWAILEPNQDWASVVPPPNRSSYPKR
jgi:ribonuclease HI